LIERVARMLSRAFRSEVGLDAMAREALFAAKGENCKQTHRSLLLGGKGGQAHVTPQGKSSEKLEDQHFVVWGCPVTSA
jgi:hypothetical protein